MRVILRDASSQRLGSATRFVEVPDVGKGHLTLSGIALAADRVQTPVAADSAEGPVGGDDPNGTPAVRIFKSGSAIVYGYQILNARSDRDKKTQLEVQTRLFRDGQEVYVGAPSALPVEGQQNPKRLVGVGRMQLAQAAPGNYILQVIVTDKLAKDKYRIAAQSMDFEIQ